MFYINISNASGLIFNLLLLLLSCFSRVRLCDPRDGSPPGFPVPGILQEKTLEWVAISGPIASWQIDGETRETETIFSGFKITADGDCSHEIKGCLLLGRKVMTNLDSIFKSINSLVLSFLYSPTLTSIHDYWKKLP